MIAIDIQSFLFPETALSTTDRGHLSYPWSLFATFEVGVGGGKTDLTKHNTATEVDSIHHFCDLHGSDSSVAIVAD